MYKKKDEERAKRDEEEKALEEQKKKSKYVVFVGKQISLFIKWIQKLFLASYFCELTYSIAFVVRFLRNCWSAHQLLGEGLWKGR